MSRYKMNTIFTLSYVSTKYSQLALAFMYRCVKTQKALILHLCSSALLDTKYTPGHHTIKNCHIHSVISYLCREWQHQIETGDPRQPCWNYKLSRDAPVWRRLHGFFNQSKTQYTNLFNYINKFNYVKHNYKSHWKNAKFI